jgi:hypothetical protein
MKKKRAGVGKRRSSSRRPTRAATSGPNEGGRQFRYFQVERRAGLPKPSGHGRQPKVERTVPPQRIGVSDAVVQPSYYEPPPPPKPFWTWSDEEIFAWLDTQDRGYQETARQMAAMTGMDVAASERRRSSSPCVCGYDGTPSRMHKWNCEVGFIKEPPLRWAREPVTVQGDSDEDDDDDLPF